MALPMSDPYRGYAPVTHDTNRVAEVITELNTFRSDVTSSDTAQNNNITSVTNNFNAHNGANGHAGIYSPSANQYYVESTNGGGGSLVQTISNNTITVLDLANPVSSNGGGFNAGGDYYQVPAGGTYLAHLHVRIWDSSGACNVALQVHDSSSLDYYTGWNQHSAAGTGGTRHSFQYMRVATWSGGTVLRAYIYQDSGFAMLLSMIFFSIWRIG